MVDKKRSFFKSIRGKIIGQMMLISLIPLLIIGIVTYINMSDAQTKVGNTVDDTWAEMEQKVVAVSLENQASGMADEMTGTVGYQVLDLIQIMSTPSVVQMMLGMGDASVAQILLDTQIMLLGSFTELTITDLDGIVLATTSTDTAAGDDLSSEAWWNTDSFISILPAEEGEVMEMVLWLPIPNPFNMEENLGRMIGTLKMESAETSKEYADRLEQGRMSVFLGKNLVADTGDANRPYQEELSLNFVEQAAFQAIDQADRDLDEGEMLPTVSGYVSDDEAGIVAAYTRPGAEAMASSMPPILQGTGSSTALAGTGNASDQAVVIVMQQPKEVAFAPIASLEDMESDLSETTNSTLIMSIAVLVVVAISALAIAVWLSRMITRPILSLHQGVEEVIDGNLEVKVGSAGNDEIGELSRAFDHMTENVRESQEKLREINLNLEKMVEERTQELREAHSQLEVYADDLKRSNQELDDFAYIASHDLKEPLRGIHNYSSFLLEDYEDKLDEDGQAKLNTLMRLTGRLEDLIDGLLYYSRAGRAELGKQENNTGEIVKGILETLESSLQEQGVTVDVAEDMPTVVCDPTKVGEVFRNLITNAMKYNDKEDKRIEIGWQKDEKGEPVFFVQDNGIGIKEKDLDKVFKMFTRLHGRDKFGGGTGSGLTLARKIIQRHGGDMWVESEFGKGTTFFFNLA